MMKYCIASMLGIVYNFIEGEGGEGGKWGCLECIIIIMTGSSSHFHHSSCTQCIVNVDLFF